MQEDHTPSHNTTRPSSHYTHTPPVHHLLSQISKTEPDLIKDGETLDNFDTHSELGITSSGPFRFLETKLVSPHILSFSTLLYGKKVQPSRSLSYYLQNYGRVSGHSGIDNDGLGGNGVDGDDSKKSNIDGGNMYNGSEVGCEIEKNYANKRYGNCVDAEDSGKYNPHTYEIYDTDRNKRYGNGGNIQDNAEDNDKCNPGINKKNNIDIYNSSVDNLNDNGKKDIAFNNYRKPTVELDSGTNNKQNKDDCKTNKENMYTPLASNNKQTKDECKANKENMYTPLTSNVKQTKDECKTNKENMYTPLESNIFYTTHTPTLLNIKSFLQSIITTSPPPKILPQTPLSNIYQSIVNKHISKQYKIIKQHKCVLIANRRKISIVCVREIKRALSKTMKTNPILKSKKISKEINMYFKRSQRNLQQARSKVCAKENSKETIKEVNQMDLGTNTVSGSGVVKSDGRVLSAYKRRMEKAMQKKEEEERERVRQKRKLNFLITQTELFSHFMSNKGKNVVNDDKSNNIHGKDKAESMNICHKSNSNKMDIHDSNIKDNKMNIHDSNNKDNKINIHDSNIKYNNDNSNIKYINDISNIKYNNDSSMNIHDTSNIKYNDDNSNIKDSSNIKYNKDSSNNKDNIHDSSNNTNIYANIKDNNRNIDFDTDIFDEKEDLRFAQEKALEAAIKQKEKLSTFDQNNKNINTIPIDKNSNTKELIVSQPISLNATLKKYQLEGLSWLTNLYDNGINGILADDMGLGKTIQSIAFLGVLKERYNIEGPFLIVTPASTLHNWISEFNKFLPSSHVILYAGSVLERKNLRKNITFNYNKKNNNERTETQEFNPSDPVNVIVTSYQMVVTDEKFFKRTSWAYMILDEAQAIKSSNSIRWKTLLNLNCRNRLLLTGTPVQNTMGELWALLHFIMPTLFDSHEEFSKWFSKDIEGKDKSKKRRKENNEPVEYDNLVYNNMIENGEDYNINGNLNIKRDNIDDNTKSGNINDNTKSGNINYLKSGNINDNIEYNNITNSNINNMKSETMNDNNTNSNINNMKNDNINNMKSETMNYNNTNSNINNMKNDNINTMKRDNMNYNNTNSNINNMKNDNINTMKRETMNDNNTNSNINNMKNDNINEYNMNSNNNIKKSDTINYNSEDNNSNINNRKGNNINDNIEYNNNINGSINNMKNDTMNDNIEYNNNTNSNNMKSDDINDNVEDNNGPNTNDSRNNIMQGGAQLKRLHMVLKPFMLRRIKDDVKDELGTKTEKVIMCDMSIRQKKYYRMIQEQRKIYDDDLIASACNITDTTNNQGENEDGLMNVMMQFRKVCNHPDIFEREEVRSGMYFGIDDCTRNEYVRRIGNNKICYKVGNLVGDHIKESREVKNNIYNTINIIIKENGTFKNRICKNRNDDLKIRRNRNKGLENGICRNINEDLENEIYRNGNEDLENGTCKNRKDDFENEIYRNRNEDLENGTCKNRNEDLENGTCKNRKDDFENEICRNRNKGLENGICRNRNEDLENEIYRNGNKDLENGTCKNRKDDFENGIRKNDNYIVDNYSADNDKNCTKKRKIENKYSRLSNNKGNDIFRLKKETSSFIKEISDKVYKNSEINIKYNNIYVKKVVAPEIRLISSSVKYNRMLDDLEDYEVYNTSIENNNIIDDNDHKEDENKCTTNDVNNIIYDSNNIKVENNNEIDNSHKIGDKKHKIDDSNDKIGDSNKIYDRKDSGNIEKRIYDYLNSGSIQSYNIEIPRLGTFITDSGKLSVLDILLSKLKNEGKRILIYFQMTKMMDLMEDYLIKKGYSYSRLDGSSRLKIRRDLVKNWQETNDKFIFILSTRAGGLGINLTAADTVIFYDSDWNPTVDQQAMDRAHRLGQTKDVMVYRMITRNSIEERVMEKAGRKGEIQKMVIKTGEFNKW